MNISDDMRQKMIQELQQASGYKEIPEGAMTKAELAEVFPQFSEDQLYKWIRGMIADGQWVSHRRGNQTYYWSVE